MELKTYILLFLIIWLLVGIPLYAILIISGAPPEGETSTVMATVIDSDYQAGYYIRRWTGKFYTNAWCEPKYLITVEYNGITLEIDNEDLYNLYQKGELKSLPCVYHVIPKSNECYLTYGG